MSPERPTEINFPEFEEIVPVLPPRLVRQDAVYIEVESENENENQESSN